MGNGDERLRLAAAEYIGRQNFSSHPRGKFDGAKRWFPSTEEWRECCDGIRRPSRRFPYSLLRHCRSIRHIANLFGVGEKELRKAVKHLEFDEVMGETAE